MTDTTLMVLVALVAAGWIVAALFVAGMGRAAGRADEMAVEQLAALDVCRAISCPGMEDDPDYPALVCTLPAGHEGMHEQHGRSGRWLEGVATDA